MKKVLVSLIFLAFLIVSCGNDGAKEEKIEPICLTPKAGPYELKFTDISEEMGVKKLNALGTQITVADIDGDRWPDIYTSITKKMREDQNEPKNIYKLLKNVKGKNFEDITFSSGLFTDKKGTNGIASTYVVFADMNNDGFQDAFNVVYVDNGTFDEQEQFQDDYSRVYLNNGDGTFKYVGGNFILDDMYSAIAGVAFLDYDHDGIIDMFIGRQYNSYGSFTSCEQDTLMKGDGNGKFENVVKGKSGLETETLNENNALEGKFNKPTWGVSACDVDGDGFADILTSSYGRTYNALYRNKGDGTFEDLSVSSNFAHDDNENYSDDQFFACYCEEETDKNSDYCSGSKLLVSSCNGMGSSWIPGFSDQPYRLGGNSAGTLCGDFDGDGDTDLFQIELAHWHVGEASDKSQLILNDGFPEKPLKRVPEEESGITRKRSGSWNDGDLGGFAADFDNDGRLDIYLLSSDYSGTKSMLFMQQSDGRFEDVAKDAGVQIPRAHGGAFVDIDRDGDYDLIVGTSFMRWSDTDSDGLKKPEKQWIKVLRNDTGQNANKVIIYISGSTANRDAIGAKIIVKAGGKQFVREVQGAYGLNGFQNDHLQIIGLGDICEVEEIEVRWPDKENSVTRYDKVFANYVLEINQETGLKHHKIEDYFAKQSGEEK